MLLEQALVDVDCVPKRFPIKLLFGFSPDIKPNRQLFLLKNTDWGPTEDFARISIICFNLKLFLIELSKSQ